MTWLLVLSLVGLALAVLVVLGPLRQEPLWVRPENSVSHRQRRRRGFGLLLLVAGYTVNWLNSVAEANLGLVTWVLIGLGGWSLALFPVGRLRAIVSSASRRAGQIGAGRRT